MGGHATHDEREARDTFPAELFAEWGKRDPVGLFEAYLMERGLDQSVLEKVEAETTAEMNQAAEDALESRDKIPPPEQALYDGFSQGGVLHGLDVRPI